LTNDKIVSAKRQTNEILTTAEEEFVRREAKKNNIEEHVLRAILLKYKSQHIN